MFGRRPEPKGWKGFSTLGDEEARPPKAKGAWVSSVLAPVATLSFAVGIGGFAGVAAYCMVGYTLKIMAFSFFSLSLFVIFGVAGSLGVWARAFHGERRTRYVSEHYKDARPPWKRPESERERAWRERQVERELGLSPESRDNDSGRK